LTPIHSSYRDWFTINAVIPFDEPYIDTNQELFDSGFKLLCWTLGFYTYTFNSSPSLRKLNLEWDRLEQYLFTNSSIKYWADNNVFISRHRDKVMYAEGRERARREMILAERVPGTQCHMLEEYWIKETHGLFYTDPLIQALHDTFSRLLQAGIMEFWESAFKIVENRRLSILAVTNMGYNIESEIESMNSAIESLFQIFLILHSVNVICIVAEVVYVKLKAHWSLLIMKRRNRKAIWSLGKI